MQKGKWKMINAVGGNRGGPRGGREVELSRNNANLQKNMPLRHLPLTQPAPGTFAKQEQQRRAQDQGGWLGHSRRHGGIQLPVIVVGAVTLGVIKVCSWYHSRHPPPNTDAARSIIPIWLLIFAEGERCRGECRNLPEQRDCKTPTPGKRLPIVGAGAANGHIKCRIKSSTWISSGIKGEAAVIADGKGCRAGFRRQIRRILHEEGCA